MKDRLYNPELKLAYLNDFVGEESTKAAMIYEFYKSAKVEKQYNKDLYAFFDDEIEDLLLSLGSDNLSSIGKTVSIYKDYVNWCILNGQRGKYENGENRVEIFQATKDMSKYVSNMRVKNKFLTQEEVYDLVDYLVNPIDQVFILGIYEFIAGEELYELRSLSMKNVDIDNRTVKVTDVNGNTRIQSVSHKLIGLLQDANRQETYLNNNGVVDNEAQSTRKLAESEYIMRPIARKSNKDQMMPYGSLSQKMVRIKRFTGYDFITINSIQDSRVIHEIVEVMKRLEIDKPNDEVFRIVVDNIYKQYKVKLTSSQIFYIRRNFEQAIKLKDFT